VPCWYVLHISRALPARTERYVRAGNHLSYGRKWGSEACLRSKQCESESSLKACFQNWSSEYIGLRRATFRPNAATVCFAYVRRQANISKNSAYSQTACIKNILCYHVLSSYLQQERKSDDSIYSQQVFIRKEKQKRRESYSSEAKRL